MNLVLVVPMEVNDELCALLGQRMGLSMRDVNQDTGEDLLPVCLPLALHPQ